MTMTELCDRDIAFGGNPQCLFAIGESLAKRLTLQETMPLVRSENALNLLIIKCLRKIFPIIK